MEFLQLLCFKTCLQGWGWGWGCGWMRGCPFLNFSQYPPRAYLDARYIPDA